MVNKKKSMIFLYFLIFIFVIVLFNFSVRGNKKDPLTNNYKMNYNIPAAEIDDKFNHEQIVSVLSLHFVLGDDIEYGDMGSKIMYPIGYNISLITGIKRAVFTGVFDGRGFDINDLRVGGFDNIIFQEEAGQDYFIDTPTTSYVSMFTENEGIIRNFGLNNPRVEFLDEHLDINKASNIVGLNLEEGTLTNVYVNDDRDPITGSGILMATSDDLTQSYSASGIVYNNEGTFENSYIVTNTVVYSTFLPRFDVQPLYYLNSGETSNVYYESDIYKLSLTIGSTTYTFSTPHDDRYTKKTKRELERQAIPGFYNYQDYRYPAFFGHEKVKYTGQDYYLINNAVDLVYMSRYLRLPFATSGLRFLVTEDINMSQVAKTAYKTPTAEHTGEFIGKDGINKVISNLVINERAYSNNEYHMGLFGITDNIIKNITISNASLVVDDSDENTTTISNYGILVGSKKKRVLESVYIEGTIDLGTKMLGETNVGLLFGSGGGPVTDVYVTGTIEANNHDMIDEVGVNYTYNIGGLVGLNRYNALVINDSTVDVDINGLGTTSPSSITSPIQINIGGILGAANTGNAGVTLSNVVYEEKTIKPAYFENSNVTQSVAGIIGESSGKSNLVMNGPSINKGTLDLTGTGDNMVYSSGGIVANHTNKETSFYYIYNYGTFIRNDYNNFYFTTLLLNRSNQRVIEFKYGANYANIVWEGNEFSGIFQNLSPSMSGTSVLREIENYGDITVENRTLTDKLTIAGISTSPIALASVTYQGTIKLLELETEYPIFVAGLLTETKTGNTIRNSSTYGDIFIAGIDTSANIYAAGLVNLQNNDISDSINGLNINSYYSSAVNGITGKGNVYAGGISSIINDVLGTPRPFEYVYNTGDIQIVNKSAASLSDLNFSSTNTHFNKFMQKSSIEPGITKGVVVAGISAVGINNSNKVYGVSNDGNILGLSNHYVRAAGIIGINGEQEIKAGIVDINDLFPGVTVNNGTGSLINGALNYGNITAISNIIGDYEDIDKPRSC